MGSEHIAHIRVIQVLPVADNWIDEDDKAVEILFGLRYLKTSIAHTTLYQCCVSTKKTRPRQREVLSTVTLQCRANVQDIGPRINQHCTEKYIGLTNDITVLFKQR